MMRPPRSDLKAGLILSGVGLFILLTLLLTPLWLGIVILIGKSHPSWASLLRGL
jgi:hypothetical protein